MRGLSATPRLGNFDKIECFQDAVSGANIPPGYANEKKVDHLTMILEVLVISILDR